MEGRCLTVEEKSGLSLGPARLVANGPVVLVSEIDPDSKLESARDAGSKRA